MLAVLNYLQILRLKCPKFVLKLVGCRQFGNTYSIGCFDNYRKRIISTGSIFDRATNSRKSKSRNDKAVNSPYFKGPLQPKFPSHSIIYYEEFEGADHESAAYSSVSCIVSNL